MLLLIKHSNVWIKKNFHNDTRFAYTIQKKITFDKYPKIISIDEFK